MQKNNSHKIRFDTYGIAILTVLLLMGETGFAQKRLTDFYSNDASTETPVSLTEFGGKTYFLATDIAHGRNVWVSDGTKSGTRFFLETEPNLPKFNQLLSYQTNSFLYIFSNKNLWQIDAQQNIKKLNTSSLLIARSISYFDNKLFFNALEYYDLKDQTFRKLIANTSNKNASPVYFYEGIHDKLRAFSFYGNQIEPANTLFILEPNQTEYKPLKLGSRFTFGLPSKIYNFGNEYFGPASGEGIFKFNPNTDPQMVANMAGKLLHQYVSNGILYLITNNQSDINQYTFDGKVLDLISTQNFDWNGIDFLKPLASDSLFYAVFRQGNTLSNQIVSLPRAGKLTTKITLSDNLVYNGLLKIHNDSVVSISSSIQYYSNTGLGPPKTAIINLKKMTATYRSLGDVSLLANGNFIGQKQKNPSSADVSLYNDDTNEFLIPATGAKGRPKTIGMTADLINKTLFVGFNEYDNVKAIYAFIDNNDQGQRILAQKDSAFKISTRPSGAGGSEITDEITIYNAGSIANYSKLIEYIHTNFQSNVFIYDYLKNLVEQRPYLENPYQSTTKKYFVVDADKIRQVDIFFRNTLKTFNFPAKFQVNRIFQIENQFYFWGAESGQYANQLFVFDMEEGLFKRITDRPVRNLYQFKDRPVLLFESGEVALLDSKKSYSQYHLFSMNLNETKGKGQFHYVNKGDFFIFSNLKEIYYSDGNCKNSGQINIPDYNGFWNCNQIGTSFYYILQDQKSTYLVNGTTAKELSITNANFVGVSNKNAYYTTYKRDKNNINYDIQELYQMDLKSLQSKYIDSTLGYYYNPSFKVLEDGKRWALFLSSKQFMITDGGKNADDIKVVAVKPVYNYSQTILANSKDTLTLTYRELILSNLGSNKIIAKTDSNDYLVYQFLQSNEYIYVPVLSTNGLVKRIMRVTKQDYTVKIIELPYAITKVRTRSDVASYYPISLVGDRLYAIIYTPNEGMQVWLLDEIKQSQLLSNYQEQAEQEWSGNEKCVEKRLNQVIPTDKIEQYGIFPNPTSKYLFLNLPKAEREDIQEMTIYSIGGQVVNSQLNRSNFVSAPDLIGLDLPNLSVGTYFLKVQLSSKTLTYKFVVL